MTESNTQRDIRFVLFAKLLYLVSRLALPPLILAHLGLAEYGLWATCFILVSYIGLSTSGIAVVYVRFVAEFHARGDLAAINRLLSTGVMLMGGIGLAVMLCLTLALPSLLALFHVPPSQQALASTLWLGASAIFLLDASAGAFAYLLHGLQRIRSEQQIWVCAFLLEALLIAAFLSLGWGAHGLLAAFALRYAFSCSAAIIVARRVLPGLAIHPALFERESLRRFLGYGGRVQLSGLLANALNSAERVIAGLLLGPQATALLELGTKLPGTMISVPGAINGVAVPAAARLGAIGDGLALQALYRQTQRITALLLALPMPLLAVFALPICSAWLGPKPEVASVAAIMAWMTLASHLHVLTGAASSVLRGIGNVRNEFVCHAMRAGGLGAAVLFVHLSGQQGVSELARALAVGMAVAALGCLAWNEILIGGSLRRLSCRTLLPTLVGYPLALALQALLPPISAGSREQIVFSLLAAAALYSAATGAALYFFVLDAAERQPIGKAWQRLMRRPLIGGLPR